MPPRRGRSRKRKPPAASSTSRITKTAAASATSSDDEGVHPLEVKLTEDGIVQLTWQEAPDAQQYKVWYRGDGEEVWESGGMTGGVVARLQGLPSDKGLEFRVTAHQEPMPRRRGRPPSSQRAVAVADSQSVPTFDVNSPKPSRASSRSKRCETASTDESTPRPAVSCLPLRMNVVTVKKPEGRLDHNYNLIRPRQSYRKNTLPVPKPPPRTASHFSHSRQQKKPSKIQPLPDVARAKSHATTLSEKPRTNRHYSDVFLTPQTSSTVSDDSMSLDHSVLPHTSPLNDSFSELVGSVHTECGADFDHLFEDISGPLSFQYDDQFLICPEPPPLQRSPHVLSQGHLCLADLDPTVPDTKETCSHDDETETQAAQMEWRSEVNRKEDHITYPSATPTSATPTLATPTSPAAVSSVLDLSLSPASSWDSLATHSDPRVTCASSPEYSQSICDDLSHQTPPQRSSDLSSSHVEMDDSDQSSTSLVTASRKLETVLCSNSSVTGTVIGASPSSQSPCIDDSPLAHDQPTADEAIQLVKSTPASSHIALKAEPIAEIVDEESVNEFVFDVLETEEAFQPDYLEESGEEEEEARATTTSSHEEEEEEEEQEEASVMVTCDEEVKAEVTVKVIKELVEQMPFPVMEGSAINKPEPESSGTKNTKPEVSSCPLEKIADAHTTGNSSCRKTRLHSQMEKDTDLTAAAIIKKHRASERDSEQTQGEHNKPVKESKAGGNQPKSTPDVVKTLTVKVPDDFKHLLTFSQVLSQKESTTPTATAPSQMTASSLPVLGVPKAPSVGDKGVHKGKSKRLDVCTVDNATRTDISGNLKSGGKETAAAVLQRSKGHDDRAKEVVPRESKSEDHSVKNELEGQKVTDADETRRHTRSEKFKQSQSPSPVVAKVAPFTSPLKADPPSVNTSIAIPMCTERKSVSNKLRPIKNSDKSGLEVTLGSVGASGSLGVVVDNMISNSDGESKSTLPQSEILNVPSGQTAASKDIPLQTCGAIANCESGQLGVTEEAAAAQGKMPVSSQTQRRKQCAAEKKSLPTEVTATSRKIGAVSRKTNPPAVKTGSPKKKPDLLVEKTGPPKKKQGLLVEKTGPPKKKPDLPVETASLATEVAARHPLPPDSLPPPSSLPVEANDVSSDSTQEIVLPSSQGSVDKGIVSKPESCKVEAKSKSGPASEGAVSKLGSACSGIASKPGAGGVRSGSSPKKTKDKKGKSIKLQETAVPSVVLELEADLQNVQSRFLCKRKEESQMANDASKVAAKKPRLSRALANTKTSAGPSLKRLWKKKSTTETPHLPTLVHKGPDEQAVGSDSQSIEVAVEKNSVQSTVMPSEPPVCTLCVTEPLTAKSRGSELISKDGDKMIRVLSQEVNPTDKVSTKESSGQSNVKQGQFEKAAPGESAMPSIPSKIQRQSLSEPHSQSPTKAPVTANTLQCSASVPTSKSKKITKVIARKTPSGTLKIVKILRSSDASDDTSTEQGLRKPGLVQFTSQTPPTVHVVKPQPIVTPQETVTSEVAVSRSPQVESVASAVVTSGLGEGPGEPRQDNDGISGQDEGQLSSTDIEFRRTITASDGDDNRDGSLQSTRATGAVRLSQMVNTTAVSSPVRASNIRPHESLTSHGTESTSTESVQLIQSSDQDGPSPSQQQPESYSFLENQSVAFCLRDELINKNSKTDLRAKLARQRKEAVVGENRTASLVATYPERSKQMYVPENINFGGEGFTVILAVCDKSKLRHVDPPGDDAASRIHNLGKKKEWRKLGGFAARLQWKRALADGAYLECFKRCFELFPNNINMNYLWFVQGYEESKKGPQSQEDCTWLAMLALRLIQWCVAVRNWKQAGLVLFYLHQHGLNYNLCDTLMPHQLATLVTIVMAHTKNLPSIENVLAMAGWYSLEEGAGREAREHRLLALQVISRIVSLELGEHVATLTANVKQTLFGCLLKLLSAILEGFQQDSRVVQQKLPAATYEDVSVQWNNAMQLAVLHNMPHSLVALVDLKLMVRGCILTWNHSTLNNILLFLHSLRSTNPFFFFKTVGLVEDATDVGLFPRQPPGHWDSVSKSLEVTMFSSMAAEEMFILLFASLYQLLPEHSDDLHVRSLTLKLCKDGDTGKKGEQEIEKLLSSGLRPAVRWHRSPTGLYKIIPETLHLFVATIPRYRAEFLYWQQNYEDTNSHQEGGGCEEEASGYLAPLRQQDEEAKMYGNQELFLKNPDRGSLGQAQHHLLPNPNEIDVNNSTVLQGTDASISGDNTFDSPQYRLSRKGRRAMIEAPGRSSPTPNKRLKQGRLPPGAQFETNVLKKEHQVDGHLMHTQHNVAIMKSVDRRKEGCVRPEQLLHHHWQHEGSRGTGRPVYEAHMEEYEECVEGYGDQVQGYGGYVEGLVEGHGEHVEGYGGYVEGHGEHVEGYDGYVEGHGVHVEGYGEHVEGHAAHVEGYGEHVEGHAAHVEGHAEHVEGHAVHDVYGEHVEGYVEQVEGQGKPADVYGKHVKYERGFHDPAEYGEHVDIYGEQVYHVDEHVEGYIENVEEYGEHVEGYGEHVEGYGEHIEGYGEQVEGYGEHIEGYGEYGQEYEGVEEVYEEYTEDYEQPGHHMVAYQELEVEGLIPEAYPVVYEGTVDGAGRPHPPPTTLPPHAAHRPPPRRPPHHPQWKTPVGRESHHNPSLLRRPLPNRDIAHIPQRPPQLPQRPPRREQREEMPPKQGHRESGKHTGFLGDVKPSFGASPAVCSTSQSKPRRPPPRMPVSVKAEPETHPPAAHGSVTVGSTKLDVDERMRFGKNVGPSANFHALQSEVPTQEVKAKPMLKPKGGKFPFRNNPHLKRQQQVHQKAGIASTTSSPSSSTPEAGLPPQQQGSARCSSSAANAKSAVLGEVLRAASDRIQFYKREGSIPLGDNIEKLSLECSRDFMIAHPRISRLTDDGFHKLVSFVDSRMKHFK